PGLRPLQVRLLFPGYYLLIEHIASFAPKGREGMYMGLSIVPVGIGGLAGGVLSGRLVARYLPKEGPRAPLSVWGTYAAIGVGCATFLAAYGYVVTRRRITPEAPALGGA